MDRDRFPMTPTHEPNPLRPYYVPPSIGQSTPFQSAQIPKAGVPRSNTTIPGSARDLLPDIDLDIKTTTSEAWQHTRGLFDTLAWRYFSIVLAQPFDVSKTILQVCAAPSPDAPSTPKIRRTRPSSDDSRSRRQRNQYDSRYDDVDEDESTGYGSDGSDDIPDYFTATAPRSRSPRRRKRTPPEKDLSLSPTPRPRDRRERDLQDEYRLKITKPDSIMQAISALYNTSGAVGLWRATNTTFLYTILLRTTDSFLRSLLLAVLGLPDIPGPDQGGLAPGLTTTGGAGFSGIDLSDSPNPLGSLLVVGLASALTGLLLAPLDLVRTRLIVTPISTPPRGLVQNLRRLPLLAPSALWLPTTLYHAIPNLFSAAAPLVLRRHLRVTPQLTPALWSLAAFTTSLSELFVRLPLETVLRRAQLAGIRRADPDVPLILPAASSSAAVPPTPYVGVAQTVYAIVYLEGETVVPASAASGRGGAAGLPRVRRGQGVAGLVRGWRVGFWGLVGVWAAGALGPADGKGRGEF